MLLIGVAAVSLAVFAVLTVAVVRSPSLAIDSSASELAEDLRAPWLDDVARVITTFGLIAIVGSAVILGAIVLTRRRHLARAGALVLGAALAWVGVWVTKGVVDRPRPPKPLVNVAGQSYPSAHSANAVGWLALAIALGALIGPRAPRVTAIAGGAVLAVLVGLSRIYLGAHYLSDVLAGEALAVAMYALAALGAAWWMARHGPPVTGRAALDRS